MSSMENKPTDSPTIILIPAYEPGSALIESTNKLVADQCIVVVVDDGSGLNYQQIFNMLNENIHHIKHSDNLGKGMALKSGYRYIRDTFQNYVVVTADADGQHHIGDIKNMAETYKLQPHTLLLGVRAFESKNVPLRSKFGNILTRKLFSLVTRQQLSDTQTGLRAFDASLIDFMIDVPGERFEYEMNVLLSSSAAQVKLVELPILTIYEENNESSHFNPIRDSWAIYKEVFKFASSSLLSFGIDYGLFIILLHLTGSWGLAASVAFANIVSRIVSGTFNFTMNKHLIFKQKGSLAKGTLSYILLASCILIGNTILLNLLTGPLHINPYIAKIVTEISFFSLSYIVQKNIIFAKKTNVNRSLA